MKSIKLTLISILVLFGLMINVKALSHNEPFVDTTKSAPSDFVKTFRTEIPRIASPIYKNG